MKILRTPDKYFANIKGYPFDPIYTDIFTDDGTEIRIHHIDEGPSDGPILLAMHGQPVWSYLYSKMIPNCPLDCPKFLYASKESSNLNF